jgi:hypothetical protein
VSANGQPYRRTGRYTGRSEPITRSSRSAPLDYIDIPPYTSRRAAQRPDIQPVDPATPGECLCGDPADFVIETNWFSGRRSLDPVCERHVTEVLAAITKEQARRDGG